jgi:lipopolysaccharide heptosyltransferase II
MRDYCFYVLYRAGSALLAALPLPLLFRLGQFAGFGAWLILPHYRRLSLRNLSIAFAPEKTPAELRRLVRQHFQQLGANILCSVKLGAMPVDQIEQRVEIENIDLIHQHLRHGRPVVLLLSHLGNWELCAQLLPKFIGYVRNSTIYQRLGNRRIDEHVRRLRARTGVEMFDRKEGFQKAIDLLRGGGAIGILCDQHAGDQGLWVPFFGKLASTSPLPALLAKRTNAALVGIAFYTSGLARWRVVIGPSLETKGNSLEALTAQANQVVAGQIRLAPADWFWVHNRWKTPRPNFLLNRYKRGVYVPPDFPTEHLKPFRILIRSSNWLGDSVMSVPAVRAIKHGRPDAYVTVAAPARLAPMWKLVAEVDNIILLPPSSIFAAVRAIRQAGEFDVAILFPNSLRAALETWLAGVPRRVGYRGHHRSWLIKQIVRQRTNVGRIEHQAEKYMRIARDAGSDVTELDLGVTVPRIDRNGAVTKVGLCPGAEYGPAKRWLPEHFAAAAAAVSAQRRVQWILFGTMSDAGVGEVIATALAENCVNRIGRTSLEELIEELRACQLLLTNDTGTMHLAALLGVPTISIFGSTEPRMTAPLGAGHTILRHHVECSPCFLRECPIDFRCMKAVSVVEVTAAVLARLR